MTFAFDAVLSPLFHIPIGRIDLVMGPKIDIAMFGYSETDADGYLAQDAAACGLAYGTRFGVFGGVGNLAVGGLVGHTGTYFSSHCTSSYGRTEVCGDASGSLHRVSIVAAVLF